MAPAGTAFRASHSIERVFTPRTYRYGATKKRLTKTPVTFEPRGACCVRFRCCHRRGRVIAAIAGACARCCRRRGVRTWPRADFLAKFPSATVNKLHCAQQQRQHSVLKQARAIQKLSLQTHLQLGYIGGILLIPSMRDCASQTWPMHDLDRRAMHTDVRPVV